jgi:hypothetical protein
MQPIDTAIGHFLISGFIEKPTLTPPPSQSSLDLAFGCPALLTWPTEVAVSAPDPCGKTNVGNWTYDGGKELLISWETKCIDTSATASTSDRMLANHPTTTYKVPTGDIFGSSQDIRSMFSDYIMLRDCGGALVFTIEEKVYKQEGKADDQACQKFRSCDGIIFFQYFVKDKAGKKVAMTPYLTIFQDSFDITDTSGAVIATVSRNGWDPPTVPVDCANAPIRVWNIKYAASPPGLWATATNQWPIAEMMTMLSRRDMLRQPTGAVDYDVCEVAKTGMQVAGVFLLGLCCFCLPFGIFLICSGPLHSTLYDWEHRFFPRRMGKPLKYGN